jgi:hypothetical protein
LDNEKVDQLYTKFEAAKGTLEEQLDAVFETAKVRLAEAHEITKKDLATKFQIIDGNFQSIREIPVVLASKSEEWK